MHLRWVVPLLSSIPAVCLAPLAAEAQDAGVNQQARATQNVTIDSAALANAGPRFFLGTYFEHADSKGGDTRSGAGSVTFSLTERLDTYNSRYWIFSGAQTEFDTDGLKSDYTNFSAGYGHIWKLKERPGLSVNLGGLATAGTSDFESQDGSNSASVAILGGVQQVLPVSWYDFFNFGINTSVSYLFVEGPFDGGQGAAVAAFPFIQYSRIVQPDLRLYTRFTATLSTRDATLTGGTALFTPMIGFDYMIGTTAVGASYAWDFYDDHSGQRVGLSLVQTF